MCDECGDWLVMPKANIEGAKRFEEALNRALKKKDSK